MNAWYIIGKLEAIFCKNGIKAEMIVEMIKTYRLTTQQIWCILMIEGEKGTKEKVKRTFIEVPIFTKKWKELGLTDENLRELQNILFRKP